MVTVNFTRLFHENIIKTRIISLEILFICLGIFRWNPKTCRKLRMKSGFILYSPGIPVGRFHENAVNLASLWSYYLQTKSVDEMWKLIVTSEKNPLKPAHNLLVILVIHIFKLSENVTETVIFSSQRTPNKLYTYFLPYISIHDRTQFIV